MTTRRAAAAAVAAALALTACAAEDEPSAAPSAGGELTGTIVVQAAGGGGELKALEELAAAFEDENPGVDVQFTGIDSQGDHIARIAAGFAAGSPPDVFLLNYRRFGQFAVKDVLSPARTDELDLDDFYEAPVEAFTSGGELLCVPQNASSSVVYVNPALFEQAGVALPDADWTWDELRTSANALTAGGVESIGFLAEVRTVAPFVWSAGGELVDDTDEPTAFTLDTPEAREALTYLSGLQESGFDATQRAGEDVQDAFAAGRLAMLVDSRRAVPGLREAGVDFDVRPLPVGAGGSVSLLASDGWCVAEDSESLDAAHAFAAYTVSEEGGTVLAETGRTVPVSRTLAQSDAFLAPDEEPVSAQVFLDALDGVRRLPNVGAQDAAEEAANELLEQYFAGKLPLDEAVSRTGEATANAYAQPPS